MRRPICVLLALCMLFLGINTVSALNVVLEIDYWYSNVDEMGMWSTKSIDVYVGSNSNTYSSLTNANLKSYLNTGKTSWSCTGVSFNYVSEQSSADLVFGAITRAEATSLGIPTNVAGITYTTCPTQMATLYYGSAEKLLYRIDSAMVFLIESSAVSEVTGARKVAVHEIGHALGYFGHFDYGTVMTTYYQDMTSTTPSTAEKNHLGQVY